MATTSKRSRQLKLTVTPELYLKLQDLAAQYGQPPATLASVLLGQVIAQQTNSLNAGLRVADAMASQLTPQLVEHLKELDLKELDK